ncbi:MAG: hypothetical protein J7M19_03320, partial [Planctomycetes bacterium]|nr:hypothetical protein [Planctomycetota bacterium]
AWAAASSSPCAAAERRRLRRAKMKRPPKREPVEMPLEYGHPLEMDSATVTLFPAGHILGSAQIVVDHGGKRLLYSGDFCPQATAAAEAIEIPKAHTLIMECTYGLPEHRFPPREETVDELYSFVEKSLSAGRTPVLLCYALGKGQEVLRLLAGGEYTAAVEDETFRIAKIYEAFGVGFGDYRLLDSPARPGEVVITPSIKRAGGFLRRARVRTAAVTGWGVGGFGYRAARADVTIPLSDHADFDGLLGYAEAVGPETIYILHGPPEFGYHLAKAGFNVAPLEEKAAREVTAL